MDGCPLGPRKIVMKSHVRWGHAYAQRLERVLVDSGGGNMHFPTCLDEVLEQRDVRRAFD